MFQDISRTHTVPNHFEGKSKGITVHTPKEGSIHLGTSLVKDNPKATHGLMFLYNDVAMNYLLGKNMLWTPEGKAYTQRIPPNLYGYKGIKSWADKDAKEDLLRGKIQSFPKSLTQRIVIVGTGDSVEKILSDKASHENRLKNERFVQSMVTLSELHFNETPDIWLYIIDYLEENTWKKDCGISTLCDSVPGMRGLEQQFSSKEQILQRFRGLFEE